MSRNGPTGRPLAAPANEPTSEAINGAKQQGKRQPIPHDGYGLRVGSIKSRAAAMYAQGSTVKEVVAALGSPQLRFLKELEAKGFTVTKEKVKGAKGERNQTRYYLK